MMDTILFDLDGTLLPMDENIFTKGYFKGLVAKLLPFGYAPDQVVDAVWSGTGRMVKNDGTRPNIEAFWETFEPMMPGWNAEHRAAVEEFYVKDFHAVRSCTEENPLAAPLVRGLAAEGFTVALATNPLFPKTGIETRLSWIGLSAADFALLTTYEIMHFCKPNPQYYTEICAMLGKAPAQCLMVGNNTKEDVAAAKAAGMRTLLVTDCLICEECEDIEQHETAKFAELSKRIREIVREEG